MTKQNETNNILKEVRNLERDADKIIKPFYLMIPETERLNFLSAISNYLEINLKIESIINGN